MAHSPERQQRSAVERAPQARKMISTLLADGMIE
jgi:hypothetical protein